ncbi:hypothetical protein [Nonomuraea deserti]|nr:hypothetical protein [Nonomuraea deserti]
MNPVKTGRHPEILGFACFTAAHAGAAKHLSRLRSGMADVIFVALTIAVFAVLGLVVKAVEQL